MSDVLYGKVRINGGAGQTITITTPTGQSRTITTTGQDYTDVALAGLEEYTLNNGFKSESVLLNIGDFQEIELPAAPANLEDASWEMIQQIISAGVFGNYYAVGDTKTFEVNNKTYTAEVVAINDGTGDAAQWYPNRTVDFICKELYETTYRYNSTNTNSGGFPSSEIKTTLNSTIYSLLPPDLKSVIIAKSHSYQAGSRGSSSWSSSMVTSADKLWLPTYYEIAGGSAQYVTGETSSNNKAYTLESTIKTRNGSVYSWWLGSPYSNNNSSFWRALSIGGYDGNVNAGTVHGISICFRIGQGGDN